METQEKLEILVKELDELLKRNKAKIGVKFDYREDGIKPIIMFKFDEEKPVEQEKVIEEEPKEEQAVNIEVKEESVDGVQQVD